MRLPYLCSSLALISLACATEPAADTSDSDSAAAGEASEGDGDGDEPTGETDTEPSTGDGDGDSEPPPVPTQLPSAAGPCPQLSTGIHEYNPAGVETRSVRVWAGEPAAEGEPGGMLVFYWHGYGSAPDEAPYTLSQPVVDAITGAGGVVVAPISAPDSGEFPWFVVNASDRQDDMLLADEIVACALETHNIDPRRIHTTGMSAGGIQTSALAMARSRYIASAASFSGGVFAPLEFDDPDNKFAAMIIHGGDNDIFGGFVNFKNLSTIWFNQLVENGNFTFMCDHGGGHNVPPNYGADVVNFFFAHAYGTEPSPYAGELPSDLPSDCSL